MMCRADTPLALMVISDRISAFDRIWQVDGLNGVPGKGAALTPSPATGSSCSRSRAGGQPHPDILHPFCLIVQKPVP